jgi:hypothetical protein
LSTFFGSISSFLCKLFPEAEAPSPPGLESLLAPSVDTLSLPNPKKLSCGSGPDLVLIRFKPSDDARIGETDAGTSFTSAGFRALELDDGEASGVGFAGEGVSFPLTSFFFCCSNGCFAASFTSV